MSMYPSEPLPMAKAHCRAHAAAYVEAGWKLRTEFFADPPLDDEPCEYLLVWEAEGPPVRPAFGSENS